MVSQRHFLFILFTLMLSVSTHIFAQSPKQHEYDFRKATWGMSKKEVKKSEEFARCRTRGNRIVYSFAVAELPAKTVYYFTKEKLTHAEYNFLAYATYEEMLNAMTKKYGKPETFEKVPDYMKKIQADYDKSMKNAAEMAKKMGTVMPDMSAFRTQFPPQWVSHTWVTDTSVVVMTIHSQQYTRSMEFYQKYPPNTDTPYCIVKYEKISEADKKLQVQKQKEQEQLAKEKRRLEAYKTAF